MTPGYTNLRGQYVTTYDTLTFNALSEQFAASTEWVPPVIIDPTEPGELDRVQTLIASGNYKVVRKLEFWAMAISKIEVPNKHHGAKRQATYDDIMAQGDRFGRWILFDDYLVQVAEKDMFNRTRTGRNIPLRTEREQKLLGGLHGVFIGQSVGSSAAMACALEGICGEMSLVDFDELDPSNLNRIPAGYMDIGLNKTVVTARRINKINPFVKVHIFPEGATFCVLARILALKPDFIVEAIDNMKWKVLIREWAKKHGIPVFMPTDIERASKRAVLAELYGTEDNVPMFDGDLSPELITFIKSKDNLTWDELAGCAAGIIGPLPPKLAAGLMQVHYSLAGIPQLGGTATVVGVSAEWLIEAWALGRLTKSGWYTFKQAARMNEL